MITRILLVIFIPLYIWAQDSLQLSPSGLSGYERVKALDKLIAEEWGKAPKNVVNYGLELVNLAKSLELGDSAVAAAYDVIGASYAVLGDYENGEKYFLKSIELFKNLKLDITLSGVYANMAWLQTSKGNFQKAFEYSVEELKIIEKAGIKKYKAEILERLGTINSSMKNYEKAFEYYRRSEKLAVEIDHLPCLAVVYTNMGYNYLEQNQIDSAYLVFQKSNEIDNQLGDEIGIAYSNSNMAEINNKKGEYDAAIKKFNSALKTFKKSDRIIDEIYITRKLGESYAGKKDFNSAKKYLNESLELANQIKSYPEITAGYKQLSILNESMFNFKEALNYYKKYTDFKDSTFNKENFDKINELQTKFETAEKEKENELLKIKLETSNEIQRNYLIIGSLIIIMAVLSLVWLRKLSKVNKRLKELNATKDKFFTIIAHDLKNPFSTLMGFSRMLELDFKDNTDEENSAALSALYESSKSGFKLLENLLDWSKTQTGALKFNPVKLDIDEIIENIINLLTPNANNKNIIIKKSIDESVFAFGDKEMISTTIRNIATNAIKFTPDGGTIELEAKNSNHSVIITIKDNGVGIAKEDLDKLFKIDTHHSTLGTNSERGTGLGLIICKEFIEKNGGKINVRSQLGVGTEFILQIPRNE